MASKDDSPTNRLFTDPWNGSRTPAFLKFKRDFSAGMGATFLHEDDYSLWQACTDMDQGGQGQGADAMPAAGQNGFANAARRRLLSGMEEKTQDHQQILAYMSLSF